MDIFANFFSCFKGISLIFLIEISISTNFLKIN